MKMFINLSSTLVSVSNVAIRFDATNAVIATKLARKWRRYNITVIKHGTGETLIGYPVKVLSNQWVTIDSEALYSGHFAGKIHFDQSIEMSFHIENDVLILS